MENINLRLEEHHKILLIVALESILTPTVKKRGKFFKHHSLNFRRVLRMR